MSYDEKSKDGYEGKPDNLSTADGIHNFEEIKRIIDALSKDDKEAIAIKKTNENIKVNENIESIHNEFNNVHNIINNEVETFSHLKDDKENLKINENTKLYVNEKINENHVNSNNFLKIMILDYFKSNEWKELLKINLQEILLKYFKENQIEIFRNCLTNDFSSNLKQELSNSILNSEYTINYTQNLLEKTLCGEILYKLAERQIKEIMLKKLSA